MSILWGSPLFWLSGLVFILMTAFVAGSYPAFYLSSFNPVNTLKGNLNIGRSDALPRKILVVLQFASSVVLMIGTTIIYQEIQHGKNRPIGFCAASNPARTAAPLPRFGKFSSKRVAIFAPEKTSRTIGAVLSVDPSFTTINSLCGEFSRR